MHKIVCLMYYPAVNSLVYESVPLGCCDCMELTAIATRRVVAPRRFTIERGTFSKIEEKCT